MAIHLQDSFDRANSTTSLGTPDVGGPYSVVSGTWGILSGEAYLGTPALNAQVTFPAAANVDISAKITVDASNVQMGLMIRWVDVNNFWALARPSTGNYALYRCTAGTLTQMAAAFSFVVGTDRIGLKAHGDQIAWYRNDVQMGVLYDPWHAAAGTVAGMRNGGSSSGRCDDLLCQDQADPINYWGASPAMEPAVIEHADAGFTLTPSLYKGRNTATADESEIP